MIPVTRVYHDTSYKEYIMIPVTGGISSYHDTGAIS